MTKREQAFLKFYSEKNYDAINSMILEQAESSTAKTDKAFFEKIADQITVDETKEKLEMLPENVKAFAQIEFPKDTWARDRFLLTKRGSDLLSKIKSGIILEEQMKELRLPYKNTSLIYGPPGTGKTEFCKYAAYELNRPLVTVQFSSLIGSLLGKTAMNIHNIMNGIKGMALRDEPAVLLIDEIDAIGFQRGAAGDSATSGELARITITLLQELDDMAPGVVLIACTNREDRLDAALLRRFQNQIRFTPWSRAAVRRYLSDFEISTEIKISDADKEKYIESQEQFTASEVYQFALSETMQILMDENSSSGGGEKRFAGKKIGNKGKIVPQIAEEQQGSIFSPQR